MATESLVFDILARDRASKTFDKMGKSVDKTAHRFDRFKVAAAGFGVAFGAMAVKIGKDSVREFAEAEQAQTKLEDAFARFPALADTNIEALRAYNEQLAKKVRFDDDAIASGQAVLAQFKLTGQQLQDLTPLVADFAVKTGRDLPDAATTLGKAFLGNTRALKELGIRYKLIGDRAKDVANITELVRQKVGGFAEKEGKTAAGQAKILSNQFGELEEQLGQKLVPVLIRLADLGLKTIDWVQRNRDVVVPLGTAIAAVIVATKAWTTAQIALNIALAANPAGAVIVAITALAAIFVVGRQKSEKFRESVDGNLKAIGLAALKMASVIITAMRAWLNVTLNVFNIFVQGAAKAFGWLPEVGDDIRAAAKDFSKFKDSVIHSLDRAGAQVDELQRKLHGLRTRTVHVNVIITAFGPTSVLSPRGRALAERQHGGPVRMGQAYRVGEAGPEVFVPNRNGTIIPNGGGAGGNTYVFNFPNYLGSRQELERSLRDSVKILGGGDVQKAFGT